MTQLPGVRSVRVASATAFVLILVLTALHAVPVVAVAQDASPPAHGRDLFSGRAPFTNGGPPCGACHAISSLGFPNGGTVGPDLSGIYQTLGPEGIDVTLQTLFFPTMMPLYEKRPLAPAEQQALKAFLVQAGPSPTSRNGTVVLASLAAAGFVVLIAITWLAWRNRLRGVRAPLVEAHAGGERP